MLVACSSDLDQPQRHETGRLGIVEAPPPPPRREQRDRRAVDLFVDGIVVATIGEDQFADWPRIDLQLPPDATLDRWRSIKVETDGDPVIVDRRKYPDTAPILFPGRGRDASFGMFDPRALDKRTAPSVRVDNVREIRIELAQPVDRRGDKERLLARACTELKRGEEKPPPGKGRWQGTAYQHNIDEYWTVDMTIDLSNSKVGDKVGSVVYHGHKCRGNLYRLPDNNGRPRVVERFWHNENNICVEACIIELACDGTALDYRGLYPDGSYVAHAKLLRAK
jgi:hypothetical protein